MTLHALWLLTLAVPAFAGESAVLTSGLRLHIDRHEEAGAMVRLYRGPSVIEMPKSAVTAFDPDDPAPVAMPPLAPPPAAEQPPAALAAASPVPVAPAADPRTMVRAAAARAGLPAAFVESVAKTESGFDPAAISPKGAIGVMQLMPATAKAMGVDANDPQQNIDAGAKLLRELLLKYDGDVAKALAAYNAGEPAVDRYQGVPPYPETQHYVNTVVNTYLKNGQ